MEPRCGHLPTFSDTFSETIDALGAQEPRICAITAAMLRGTGLDAFAAHYPERCFDVGIAEGHAVSMAGGLAKQGMIPVVAIYSTFLQRAYDMLLQDVAMLGLHVVFAVDRACLVGGDGETHHGVFDVNYLRSVPGMQVLCPASQAELGQMLRRAVLEMTGPVAVRYPRGCDGTFTGIAEQPCLREGSDITLVTYGTLVNEVLAAAKMLQARGISAEVLEAALHQAARCPHRRRLHAEDGPPARGRGVRVHRLRREGAARIAAYARAGRPRAAVQSRRPLYSPRRGAGAVSHGGIGRKISC